MRYPVAALTLILALTACRSGNSASASPDDPSPGQEEEMVELMKVLERGEPWVLSSLPELDSIPAESQARLQFFPAERVTGNAGCNTLNGRFSPDSGFSGLVTTRKACLGAVAQVEYRFLEALRATQALELVEGRLVLRGESWEELAVLTPEPRG